MKGKNSLKPWIMFVCMLLLQGGATGVIMNCNGILFAAIKAEMGFRAGDLSVYYMLRSLTSAAAITFTTALVFGKKPRVVLCTLNAVFTLSFAAMCLFNRLWQWYIAAILAGIGTSCNGVLIPVVLNNWFHKNNGLVIGVTMSASGIFGALFSPIVSGLIASFGWRQAALIMGLTAFAMTVLPSLFCLYLTPEEIGEKALGDEEMQKSAAGKDTGAGSQISAAAAPVPGYIFWFALAVFTLIGSQVQFASQLSTFTDSIGLGIAAGATLNSILMVGNLSGKVILGFLADRIGIYRSLIGFSIVIGIGMLLYLLGSLTASMVLLSIGSILFGLSYAVGATGTSLVLLDIYGREIYKTRMSRLTAINTLFSAGLSVVFPYIYDFTGSFNPVFIYSIAASLIALAVLTRLYAFSKAKAAA